MWTLPCMLRQTFVNQEFTVNKHTYTNTYIHTYIHYDNSYEKNHKFRCDISMKRVENHKMMEIEYSHFISLNAGYANILIQQKSGATCYMPLHMF